MSTRRRSRRSTLGWVLAFLFAGAALWLRQDPALRELERHHKPVLQWEALENCRLEPDRNNDGDSFVISHSGGRHTLRLHFVDCPEKRSHQHNRARLAEQGAYFGGLAEKETLQIGRRAADEVTELLNSASFQAFTRWEPVYDSRRHYAHLLIETPEGRIWLDEWLVSRGLARIHTKGADLPDGTPQRLHKAQLFEAQRKARAQQLGAWALAPAGRE